MTSVPGLVTRKPGVAPYQLLPELSSEEFAALKDDIAVHGVLVPVEVDENGEVLDGHHRVLACNELGVSFPVVERLGLTETEKRHHALRANLLRRQLNREQKRQVIANVIAAEPELSNRAVAQLVGCSHNTVESVRFVSLPLGGMPPGGQVDHQARKPRARRQRPLPDVFGESVGAFTRDAQRLQLLVQDDRFPRHVGALRERRRGELLRAAGVIAGVLAAFDEPDASPTVADNPPAFTLAEFERAIADAGSYVAAAQ